MIDVQCNEGKHVVYKYDRMSAACIYPETENKLIFERGWAVMRLGLPTTDNLPRYLCNWYGGKWIDEYNECEILEDKLQCSLMGGTYNVCESPCRHTPDYPNVVCTDNCVEVCSVKSEIDTSNPDIWDDTWSVGNWTTIELENEKSKPQHIPDYSNLLKGADKNIDIAHHIDIIPINSTKHAFSIKSINFNSDESITVNFGEVNKNFMTIPEFNYTRTFQINDSFVFYCMIKRIVEIPIYHMSTKIHVNSHTWIS